MGIKIKWETAENMMNIVAFSACKAYARKASDIDTEAIQQYTRKIFEEYCKAVGITEVEEPEDFDEDDSGVDFDDEKDDEEEDNKNNSCQYSLTIKGEFVLRYMEAGHPFEEACEVADALFGEGEGE